MSSSISARLPSTRISAYSESWFYPTFLIVLLLFAGAASNAATVPAGFEDRQVASGLNSPTAMTVLDDGRVLIVQQNGVVRVVKDDALLPAPFYTVQNADTFAERGCLGIVADPGFAANQYVYIYCTVTDGAASHNRIVRVTASGDTASPASEQLILRLPNVPEGTQWHMGGALRFGVDGKLYVAVGGHEDMWQPVDTSNSQNLANPFGKILRINPDGSVPPDNPFVNTSGAYTAIYNLGLRNPFGLEIQPGTGLMYINDVGAGSWEEINQGIPGANYGWPAAEGDTTDPRYTNAVFSYPHSEGCAITGGAFYNPRNGQFPASYVGKYLFADFCAGTIRMLDPANPAAVSGFVSGIENPVNLAVAPDGSVYYVARNQNVGTSTDVGTMGKIVFTNSQVPRITQQPQSKTVFIGDPVSFTVETDGASSLQWQRNGVDIPGATSPTYTLSQTTAADDQAVFATVVRNGFGSATSSGAVLRITTNRFPVATVTSPAEGDGFRPGDTITYSGTATDAEDGPLPPSAYTWHIDFQHDTHSHPFMQETSGQTNGTVAIPEFEADAANTWFRLVLSVKDSNGQTSVTTRDVYPRHQLADLPMSGTSSNGKGPVEFNMHNGEAAANDGATIRLNNIPYAKGLGVHAPADLRYQLGGACTGRLVTDVGIDDSVGAAGSAVFQVYLDGAKAFDSGLMRGGDPRKTVNLSVAGVNELRLVVADGGDGNAMDRADWAGGRVGACELPGDGRPLGGGAPVALPVSDGGG